MFLTAIRTAANERERILELARHVREPHWITVGLNGIPEQLAGVVECERLASSITEWSPGIIPGLLQVSGYARAVTEARGFSQQDIEVRGLVGAGRQQFLTGNDSVEFVAIISDTILTDPIAPPDVMREQLAHLLEMVNHPNIEIRIVPSGIGWHPGRPGPFILYTFPGEMSVVYFEHLSSGAFIPTPHDVAEYNKAVDWLVRISTDSAESVRLINKLINEMDVT